MNESISSVVSTRWADGTSKDSSDRRAVTAKSWCIPSTDAWNAALIAITSDSALRERQVFGCGNNVTFTLHHSSIVFPVVLNARIILRTVKSTHDFCVGLASLVRGWEPDSNNWFSQSWRTEDQVRKTAEDHGARSRT